MTTAWRVVKRRHAAEAFSGEGARRFGGRWNSPGRSVVYTAESRALAVLEVLAGLGSTRPLPAYVLLPVRFPDDLVEELPPSELPEGWDARPPGSASQGMGNAWLDSGRSAVLRVPSVIVPAEANYLLNPAHEAFRQIVVGVAEDFTVDPRLASY